MRDRILLQIRKKENENIEIKQDWSQKDIEDVVSALVLQNDIDTKALMLKLSVLVELYKKGTKNEKNP